MANKTTKSTDILNSAKDVIYNKYVLYFVFLAALVDLFYAATNQDYLYCTLFILVGFLVAFFNKNMTVILTVTIASATVLRNLIRGTEMKVEGYENGNSDPLNDSNIPSNMMDSNRGNTLNKLFGDSATKAPGGNTFVGNATASTSIPARTSAALIADLKDQAIDLHDTQKKIINGFEQISPYMDKAENIIQSINGTAKTIQSMKGMPSN
jgi:hypothetical protein